MMTLETKIVYVCSNVTFACYADLTSDDGKRYLVRQNGATAFTHYMICKVRRMVFVEAKKSHRSIEIKFKRALPLLESKMATIEILEEFQGKRIEEVTGEYPEVFVKFTTGEQITFASLFEFFCNAQRADDLIDDLLDMEVIYIGQTEITSKHIRLVGHETYCKAADVVSKRNPESELFLKLLHFDEPACILATTEQSDQKIEEQKEKYKKILKTAPLKHWVTLVEAALIYKTKPCYNVHYKNNFPSREQTGYKHFLNGLQYEVHISVNEDFRAYSTTYPDGTRSKILDAVVSLPPR